MWHKRAGDTNSTWCGKKIDKVKYTSWWKYVTCPSCNCRHREYIKPKKIEVRPPAEPIKIEDVDMNKLRAYFNEK